MDPVNFTGNYLVNVNNQLSGAWAKNQAGSDSSSVSGAWGNDMVVKNNTPPPPPTIQPVTVSNQSGNLQLKDPFQRFVHLLNATKAICQSAISSTGGPVSAIIARELANQLIGVKEENMLGKSVHAQIMNDCKPSSNSTLTNSVRALWNDIIRHSNRPGVEYGVNVINDDTLASGAAPGGHVYISTGTFNRFKERGEIAFILAHELAHIEHRDAVRDKGTEMVLETLNSGKEGLLRFPDNSTKKQQMIKDVENITNQIMREDSYIRRIDEKKADRRAVDIIMNMGFNPRIAIRTLAQLGGDNSHPVGMERARSLVEYLNSRGVSISDTEFRQIVNSTGNNTNIQHGYMNPVTGSTGSAPGSGNSLIPGNSANYPMSDGNGGLLDPNERFFNSLPQGKK